MAQHKRHRALSYKKHLAMFPVALKLALEARHERAHKAALQGRSSNAYLRRLGLVVR